MSRERAMQLRIERRSFIAGTIVVWVVVVVAVMLLLASMEPQVFNPPAKTYQETVSRMKPLTPQQQWEIELVFLAGAVALFFLNYRFSYLLRRPHFAFGSPMATGRWLWWVVLSVNSYFFLPQVVLTPLLAHWGSQEIAIAARPAAPTSPEAPPQ